MLVRALALGFGLALTPLAARADCRRSSHSYYHSSSGRIVHGPTCSHRDYGAPKAICRDGTRSFSLHHRGACSRHGGVARWLPKASANTAAATPKALLIGPGPNALPNPRLTPGATNPAVTPRTLMTTICVRGWTRKVRPPEDYTEELKRRQIEQYGYADRRLGDYEEDHLIPLELGGSPASPSNLWPEPHHAAGAWGSRRKDYIEGVLKRLVCEGRLSLGAAQRTIARNWIMAYEKYRPFHEAKRPAP